MITVKMMLMPHAGDDLPIPPDDSAAFDLVAAVPSSDPVVIKPGARAAIPTGLVIGLPPDTEAQIRPRTGLALHHGVTMLCAPQTVDASYRGELHVLLVNLGSEPFVVERGARIASLVVAPLVAVKTEWPLPAQMK